MVIVYTSPGCQQCTATKKFLDMRAIAYTMKDVTKDEDAYDVVRGLGYQSLPVVVAGNDLHWSGFNPEKIAAIA